MNRDLLEIIRQYQAAVADMFPRLASHLGVRPPITNTDWACIGADQRGKTEDGIKYFIHGYGVRMNNGIIQVDFDLGDKGQIDGFDLHRLKTFISDNQIQTPLSEEEIDTEFEAAVKAGEIHYSGYILCYLDKAYTRRQSAIMKMISKVLNFIRKE